MLKNESKLTKYTLIGCALLLLAYFSTAARSEEITLDPVIEAIWLNEPVKSKELIGLCAYVELNVALNSEYEWWKTFGKQLFGRDAYYRATRLAKEEFENADGSYDDLLELSAECDGLKHDTITFTTEGE